MAKGVEEMLLTLSCGV